MYVVPRNIIHVSNATTIKSIECELFPEELETRLIHVERLMMNAAMKAGVD